jgi:dynein heavy chain
MKKGIEKEHRQYEEVKDIKQLYKIINEYMLEETKMNLVLFRDCVDHAARIARALSLERGHFMLVGTGGSGKKSLTALASALSDCILDTVEPKKVYGKKEFKEDLWRMMRRAGIENKDTTFMFCDT